MYHLPQSLPTLAELREIERLDAVLVRLARRADSGPRGLAHAALAAGFDTVECR